MPVRYADIVKRDEKVEEQPHESDDDIKSDIKKPKGGKRRHYNYNVWEYTYFPYLMEMYNLLYNEWTAKDMSEFCQFIYSVSSGEISPYLNDMTKEDEDLYFAYIIKRNNF